DWKKHKYCENLSTIKTFEVNNDTRAEASNSPFLMNFNLEPIWLKIAIIGDNDVGKTTLARRAFYPSRKHDREIEYEDTGVIILCFALDAPQTLTNIEKIWIPDIKKKFPHKMPPLLLVGNNKQIEDSIPVIDSEDFTYAEIFKSYMEVNPMNEENCIKVFDKISLACVPKVRRPRNENDPFAETKINQGAVSMFKRPDNLSRFELYNDLFAETINNQKLNLNSQWSENNFTAETIL
ncbi:32572_t:CDS:2, partial [Racocetra persica]